MIIKVINPNMSEAMTKSIAKCAQEVATYDTEILTTSAKHGVESVECFVDSCLSAPAVLSEIASGEAEGNVDAYVIACFDDPGLSAARELTNKPVIGIAEAAIAAAKFIAPNFSIVSILDRSAIMNQELLYRNSATHFCKSIRTTGMAVLEFDRTPDLGLRALRDQTEKAVKEDGAECILLGCAGFVDFAKDLRNQLGVPVLDGVVPAVKFAEALVQMELHTSKIKSWGYPEPKKYWGYEKFSLSELNQSK